MNRKIATLLSKNINNTKIISEMIDYISYIPHDNIDNSETSHTPCGRIVFKSNVEVIYKVLLRKIQ